ncbi:MAG TPA: ATP-binding protein [Lacunisphaera sp.]|nr:ATP-binding protein [Lacunisphaera sp.]
MQSLKQPSTATILALAAGAAGFATNLFGLPVFGNSEMVFGGAFTLLATYLLGPWWGACSAAIAFSLTWLTWGHPIGLVAFTLEAVVVGVLMRRRATHPIVASAIYWAFLGIPLVAIAVLRSTEFPFPANWAVIIKFPLNSLLVALFALPAFRSHRLRRLIGLPVANDDRVSLQRVLFYQLGLIVMLALATLGLFAGGQFDRALRQHAREELANDGYEVTLNLQSYLDRHRRALTLLADLQAATGVRGPLAPDPLSRMHSLHPGFLGLLVTDQAGVITASWPSRNRFNELIANHGPGLDGEPALLEPQATRRAFVGNIQRKSDFGHDLVVAMSAPILDRNGDFHGVVEGALNLERLFHAISRTGQLLDRVTVITDRSHRVVVAGGPVNAAALTSFSLHPMASAARTAASDTFRFNLEMADGTREQFIGTRHLVPEFEWEVYLAEPVWHTQIHIAEFYLATALVGALAMGLGLLLTRATAQEITQPLSTLADATRRLAAGGDTAELPPLNSGARELALIGRELRAATLTLSQTNHNLATAITERDRHQAELREVMTHLEDKVAERTRELETARIAAESANEAKSEFLASMSHELRTPLNVIVGMSELFADGYMGPVTDRQAEGARSIHDSGRHLLELINDILDLSKIEAGMLEMHVEPVDVAALAEASLRFVREAARRKNLTLVAEVSPDTEPILADERRLKQILVNLLANAVKFTPEGGRVGLLVRPAAGRDVLRFEVWDTGIGIANEHFERIFQPFRQIDSSLSRQHGGTGLGLALVRRLALLHGGCVDVESETGRGSRFGVNIPVLRPPPVEPLPIPAGRDPSAHPLSPLRILIAEDNNANNAVYDAFFQASRCEILHAADGAEALYIAADRRPDIILMDVHMPRMDGLEAIRRLRANPATAQLPVIAVTALAMPADRVRCLEAGANAYLSKPVNLRELARLISRFAPSNRSAPSLHYAQ